MIKFSRKRKRMPTNTIATRRTGNGIRAASRPLFVLTAIRKTDAIKDFDGHLFFVPGHPRCLLIFSQGQALAGLWV
jgi:hypothetical protein